jgi:hypothetical protein
MLLSSTEVSDALKNRSGQDSTGMASSILGDLYYLAPGFDHPKLTILQAAGVSS